ncbi:30S ribosomal protein S12 methylthiotransferase RimO [Ruminococcus sp.]|uniref:30S ribosomal protein S12 methylthiotransferase RimO n=1 Tax=Ruminococcus sp. TaxID=41978 RepID=UPI0026243FE9|nr:30S ribosomal protein S12 methylthiotransferase RimO [Ruminococcus sp.]MDD6989116.1 30S ribosomal protein S12 methylthiotransferase RimO [Ruminococcus sp.]MDY6200970.1 30S ribosomal protein S12 methylthiotransferase RimO [Ruminococcus sp.]
MNYKVGIVSLGCAKNQVDAEMLLFTLKNRGFTIVNDPADADAVIVNTCGFIDSAKQESIDEIIELGKLKQEGTIKAIIVTGCLAERYKNEITKQLYEVDAAIGIGANERIAEVVLEALNGKKTELFPDKSLLPMEGGRVQSTPFYTAYLKVAEGCDNCCTYCAIPLIRGHFRSRQPDEVIKEAEQLAANGVKELNVIAQDTTRYGEDLFGEPYLAKLLKRLCKIDGFKWIRVLYCYPDRVTDELIDVIAEEDKIVKYIDIPLQHCNGEVLKNMNRRGNRESLTALLNKIKAKIPNVIFRSTFITGFPGETEEQFEELADFAAEIKFQRLGCFPYSKEEDTKASLMENQIDDDIKQKHADIIMEHQQSVMAEYCESLIGSEVEVLVEGYDKLAECFFGRTYADAPEVDGCVFFTCDGEKPKAGDFVKVKITDYMGCDPVGERV